MSLELVRVFHRGIALAADWLMFAVGARPEADGRYGDAVQTNATG